jgi:uncharacterized membrane protein YesL
MAGFFGFFDYTKPGPGVPKDGPPKARILVFFEILQRKFWNLIKINMMFNIFNIPAIIVAMIISFFIFQQNIITGNVNDPAAVFTDILMRFLFASLILCIPLITVGPAQAGFTYLLRNYAREEHAFIWGDFKDAAMKNFKQSMIISGIDLVVTLLMFISIRFYILLSVNNFIMTIGTALMCMMLAIFFMMHLYIYPMLVTFTLSTKQLYKNALIFAVIKLLPNLGITLLCMVLILLTFGAIIPFSPIIGLLLYAVITVSLIGMITNFYVYPKIKKFMIKEEEIVEDDEEYEEDEEEETEEEAAEEKDDDSRDESSEPDGENKRYF